MSNLAARSPRLLGLVQLLFGAALLGMNIAMIVWTQRYYGALFILGLPMISIGVWTTATGMTPTHAGPKPPLWWMIGFYSCGAIGLLSGLYLAIHMGK
jgi:hypothetical protein